MDNQLEFDEIMTNFKKITDSKNNTEIAQKLGMNRATYSDRKQRNSIPYENLIIYCKKEKISIDLILKNQEKSEKFENFKEKLEKSIEKLNEKESKYFYHIIEAKIMEKDI